MKLNFGHNLAFLFAAPFTRPSRPYGTAARRERVSLFHLSALIIYGPSPLGINVMLRRRWFWWPYVIINNQVDCCLSVAAAAAAVTGRTERNGPAIIRMRAAAVVRNLLSFSKSRVDLTVLHGLTEMNT